MSRTKRADEADVIKAEVVVHERMGSCDCLGTKLNINSS